MPVRRTLKALSLPPGFRAFDPLPHGTDAGYNAHRRFGEQPCLECCAAHSARTTWQDFRSGRKHRPTACHMCGSVFYLEHRCSMASA